MTKDQQIKPKIKALIKKKPIIPKPLLKKFGDEQITLTERYKLTLNDFKKSPFQGQVYIPMSKSTIRRGDLKLAFYSKKTPTSIKYLLLSYMISTPEVTNDIQRNFLFNIRNTAEALNFEGIFTDIPTISFKKTSRDVYFEYKSPFPENKYVYKIDEETDDLLLDAAKRAVVDAKQKTKEVVGLLLDSTSERMSTAILQIQEVNKGLSWIIAKAKMYLQTFSEEIYKDTSPQFGRRSNEPIDEFGQEIGNYIYGTQGEQAELKQMILQIDKFKGLINTLGIKLQVETLKTHLTNTGDLTNKMFETEYLSEQQKDTDKDKLLYLAIKTTNICASIKSTINNLSSEQINKISNNFPISNSLIKMDLPKSSDENTYYRALSYYENQDKEDQAVSLANEVLSILEEKYDR